jgi:hypothetical protein
LRPRNAVVQGTPELVSQNRLLSRSALNWRKRRRLKPNLQMRAVPMAVAVQKGAVALTMGVRTVMGQTNPNLARSQNQKRSQLTS